MLMLAIIIIAQIIIKTEQIMATKTMETIKTDQTVNLDIKTEQINHLIETDHLTIIIAIFNMLKETSL